MIQTTFIMIMGSTSFDFDEWFKYSEGTEIKLKNPNLNILIEESVQTSFSETIYFISTDEKESPELVKSIITHLPHLIWDADPYSMQTMFQILIQGANEHYWHPICYKKQDENKIYIVDL